MPLQLRTLRSALALLIALGALAAIFPLAPWHERIAAALGGAGGQRLALLGLGIGALLLPDGTVMRPRRGWGHPEATALACGLLLLLEPLIHLLVLGLASIDAQAALADFVFPTLGGVGALSLLEVALFWVLLPALIEEVFFRGRLLPWLMPRVGTASAISLSTCAFAAAHGSIAQALVALPIGLLLAIVRLRSGTVYPCIVAHALHNALFAMMGGALMVAPWLPAVLMGGGVWLLALAYAVHRQRDLRHSNRRFAIAVVAGTLLALLWWPAQRALHDRLWSDAAATVLVDQRSKLRVLVQRLERMERLGLLTERRRTALRDELLSADSATPLRRCCALAVIDPAALEALLTKLAARHDDARYLAWTCLWSCDVAGARMADAALLLAAPDPVGFAAFLRHHPGAMRHWLQLPERERELGALLLALQQRQRDRGSMLRLLLREFDPDLAARALLHLPPERVLPRDRYLLRMHHPAPERWLAELAQSDRPRAEAWGWRPADTAEAR